MSFKSLFLSALLVFALSSMAFTQDVNEMSDLEILTELRENLNLRESLLNERELDLQTRETLLNTREQTLNLRETSLSALESLTTAREKELIEREQSWSAMLTFSQSLREEMKNASKSEFWRGFAVGSAVGLGVGTVAGFTLGVKIPF